MPPMKLFRLKYVSNTFTLVTGIIFLNMSFFLAEVTALKLDQDKQMMENISKLLSGCAAEEEKDVFGGSSDEDTTAKEIDLIFNYHTHSPGDASLMSKNKLHAFSQGIPQLGNYEIFSPPPEV